MPTPRRPAPVETPVVLTIAGSDSGGGAGIQADLKTIEACGGFGTSVLTAVTAQNTRGVESTHVLPIEEIEAQLDAVLSDFDLRAVKTGMLATAEVIETVTGYAGQFDVPLVVDPVMVAATGDRLLDPDPESAYDDLVAAATVVTPNADEAAVLTGVDPTAGDGDLDATGATPPDETPSDETPSDGAIPEVTAAREAGEAILEMGCEAALVKGGHLPGEEVRDVLVTADGTDVIRHPRVDTDATHGSGCMLASAIATRLAHGDPLTAAVRSGVDLLGRAVRYPHDVGEGPGAVHHLVALRNDATRHVTAEAVEAIVERFVEQDVSRLVPEVGMNVVGATPYAEGVEETAAVEGRITRTLSGVAPNRGVRFGASSHVARFLLAAREFDPDLRFAVNCRYDENVEAVLARLDSRDAGDAREDQEASEARDALDGPVGEYDRSEQPESIRTEEGSTMQWAARRAVESVEGTPVVVTDPGAVGKEPMTKVLATDGETLVDRVETVLSGLD